MNNEIQSSSFISCGKELFPQIVVKANEKDILSIASAWHEMIDKYPRYSSAIGLTLAASDENVKNIISSYGSEIDLYNLPIVIGCFACEM